MAEAGAGPTARFLKRSIQLKDSLALITMAFVPFLAPLRMIAAEM